MNGSLGKRIFRTFFINSLISLFTVVVFTWFVFEDMEDQIVQGDSQELLEIFENGDFLQKNRFWQTESLTAFYQDRYDPLSVPVLFQDLPIPFNGEKDWEGKVYNINVYLVKDGIYYIAKDVSYYEQREFLFLIMLCVLCGFALVLNFILAVLANRRLVDPLRKLTLQIRRSMPEDSLVPIDTDFSDDELQEIAHAFNWFISEIASLISRERTMISMAGHELKTPIAVISGALQVIEQRDDLGSANKKTFNRIRQATGEMQENVETLLTLSRRTRASTPATTVILDAFIEGIIDEIGYVNAEDGRRINTQFRVNQFAFATDAVLAKLLIRNLLRNALSHTDGEILVVVTKSYLEILDQGPGMPAELAKWIESQSEALPKTDGLGFYLVTLACEQLSWKLSSTQLSGWSHGFRLTFP